MGSASAEDTSSEFKHVEALKNNLGHGHCQGTQEGKRVGVMGCKNRAESC